MLLLKMAVLIAEKSHPVIHFRSDLTNWVPGILMSRIQAQYYFQEQ